MRLNFRSPAVAGASIAMMLAGGVGAPAANADSYPTWDDVKKAKASQAATQAEVGRVGTLLTGLTMRAKAAQTAATDAGSTLQQAQDAFFAADQTYEARESEAEDATATAATASTRAGRLAAQLYRSGGHNLSLALVLSSQSAAPGDSTSLLDQLGSMTKLTESSSRLWATAQHTKSAAAAASAQAKSALDARARLEQQAQNALAAAVQTQGAAQRAVADEQAHHDELSSMLAVLTTTTAATVADYEKGVRERAAAARKKKLEAERAAQRAAAAAGGKSATPSASGWVVPVAGPVVSGFGARPAPCAGCSTWHEGVDIAAPLGTPIRAAHAGTVVYAGTYGGYGNFILIDDGDGISTAYGHNVDGGIVVTMGQRVSAGQVVGHVGSTGHSTGAHLHFEVRRDGVQINPIPWMSQHGAAL